MNIHPKNPDYNLSTLPLFFWAETQQKTRLSFATVYLASKYSLSSSRAKVIAELMGLEPANDC